MYLEKWYADVVEGRQVQIRYLANLHLGPMTIGYSGCLAQGRTSNTQIGVRRLPGPTVHGDAVHWPACANNPALVWRGARSRSQQLWQDGTRAITWDPLVLNGGVTTNGSRPMRGYVERLTLNFAPWHLGISTLKWGRFCGQKHSLVWIEWQGRIPKIIALLDGEAEPLLAVEREEVRTRSARLTIGNTVGIISEPLGTGALAALGWLRMFAAQGFLAGIETKWLANACLELHGKVVDYGITVYEEVVWP